MSEHEHAYRDCCMWAADGCADVNARTEWLTTKFGE